MTRFQSAPPLRGAMLSNQEHAELLAVSIRAPLAGSDIARRPRRAMRWGFNPRPPCGERSLFASFFQNIRPFQSAPPLRGAMGAPPAAAGAVFVSIRAPLAGSDSYSSAVPAPRNGSFQSAPPLRGAMAPRFVNRDDSIVSIRAPLAGSDRAKVSMVRDRLGFQSAPPLRGAILLH